MQYDLSELKSDDMFFLFLISLHVHIKRPCLLIER